MVDANVSVKRHISVEYGCFLYPLPSSQYPPSSLPTALHFVPLCPSELCLLLQENIIPASFHDGLLLYVRAVTETLAQGGTVTDGEDITQRMWNRSFQGQGLELTGMGCFGGGSEREPQVPQQETTKSLLSSQSPKFHKILCA